MLDKNRTTLSMPYQCVTICYRDNGDTKEGKHACDYEMRKELDMLEPKGIREKINKKLVRAIIGKKRILGLGIIGINDNNNIEWSNELADELHKPIRKKFSKRHVYASGVDAIWVANLVEMQAFTRQNKGYKYILMIIDVFSKYGWAIPLKSKTGAEVARAFQQLWKT